MPHKVHSTGMENGGLAIDVKPAQPAGHQFERRLIRKIYGLFTKKINKFLFHLRVFLLKKRLLLNALDTIN
jgi:hypothetical protein